MISGRENIRDAYRDDRVAREYVRKRFNAPLGALLHARQIGVVRRLIREHSIDSAAEIAAGPARLAVDIAPGLKQLTLLDASAEMLQEARQRLIACGLASRTLLVRADAFHLPVRGQLDLAYTFRLIRHFERPDRLRLYRQIAGILRLGGWLVFDAVNERVSAPLRARAKPGEYEHYDALLRPEQLEEELKESGFEIVSLVGVQHRYSALLKCQIFVAPRAAHIARAAMEIIDRLGGEPLEWIVVCRRG